MTPAERDRLLHSDEFTRTLVGVESRVETLADVQTNLLRALGKLASAEAEADDTDPNPETLRSVDDAVAVVNKFADQLTAELHRLHELHAGKR